MTGRDPEFQALLDREDIRDVVLRYCRGVDRRDEEMIRSAFHPDATDDHGPFKGAAAAFPGWALDVLRKNVATSHLVTNQLIELEGDIARSEAYVVAVHRFERDGGVYDWVFGGRYLDRFERRDDAWKIAHRITVHDWNRVDPVAETFPPAEQFVQGATSSDDPVYCKGETR